MVRDAVGALGGKTTNVAVRDWILNKYPGTNASTIQCQIIMCTVNHPSRVHYPPSARPHVSDGQYDFLFRSAKGQLERYEPERHDRWEVFKGEDGRLGVREIDGGNGGGDEDGDEGGDAFAAEAHLRDYLVKHLDQIEKGLTLYVDEEGTAGVEYQTSIGRIDILAVDVEGGLVVVELKVSRGPDSAAGQVLRYKNWVRKHMAEDKGVRGIIIAQHVSEKLLYAIVSDPEISAKEYEIHLKLRDVRGTAQEDTI